MSSVPLKISIFFVIFAHSCREIVCRSHSDNFFAFIPLILIPSVDLASVLSLLRIFHHFMLSQTLSCLRPKVRHLIPPDLIPFSMLLSYDRSQPSTVRCRSSPADFDRAVLFFVVVLFSFLAFTRLKSQPFPACFLNR